MKYKFNFLKNPIKFSKSELEKNMSTNDVERIGRLFFINKSFGTVISNDPIIVISKNKYLVYNINEIVGHVDETI